MERERRRPELERELASWELLLDEAAAAVAAAGASAAEPATLASSENLLADDPQWHSRRSRDFGWHRNVTRLIPVCGSNNEICLSRRHRLGLQSYVLKEFKVFATFARNIIHIYTRFEGNRRHDKCGGKINKKDNELD